jgi:hypothetical protein
LLTAEAMPARSSGSAPSTAAVNGATKIVIPMPKTITPGRIDAT